MPGSPGKQTSGDSGSSSRFGSNRPGSSGSGSTQRSGGLPGRTSGGGSRFPGSPGKSTGDGKDKDKKDAPKDEKADDSASSPGERLNALRSRFSLGGNKDADGDDSKKDGGEAGGGLPGAGAVGGLVGRLPFGGGDKSDSDKDDKGGGLTSRFGRKAPSAGGDVKPADSKSGKKGGTPRLGSRGDKGVKPGGKDDKKGGKAGKPAAKAEAESAGVGARFAALTASLPFGGGKSEDKPASKTVQQRSKAPKVAKGEGLSLDRKLDILGVGLVFAAGALFLSRFSPNQGVLTEGVNNFFESLLGWGAWAVPIAMFGVGMWLIIRHFGDEPPTIDTERLIGLGIIYVAALVLFQFVQALNYTVTTYEELANLTRLGWTEEIFFPSGGGWVGGNIYLLMVRYLGEIFAFAVAIFTLIVGVMLLLDVSVSEVAIIMIGLWRSFRVAQRRSNERKKVRRAERLAQRKEQLAALTPPESQIEVSRPQAEQLPAGDGDATSGALPAPESERAIPITMGGRTVTTSFSGQQLPVEMPAQPPPQQSAPSGSGNARAGVIGGVLGGMFGRGKTSNDSPTPVAPANAENTGSASPSGSLMNRLPFGGGDAKAAPEATGAQAAPTGGTANTANATPPSANPPQAPGAQQPTQAHPQPMNQNLFSPPPAAGAAPPPSPFSAPASNQSTTASASAAGAGTPATEDSPFKSKRITQAMQAVNAETAEADGTADTAASNGSNGADGNDPATSRLDRLNAIRQGRAAHPNQAQTANAAPKPEDTAPNNGQPSTAQPSSNGEHAAQANGQAQESNGASTAAFVVGKTDAYGNAPTPPPSMGRPDDMKPRPAAVVSAPAAANPKRDWTLPDINELLNEGSDQDFDRQFLVEQARIIEDTLKSFGAPGRVVEINTGPVITQYGVEPDYLQSRSGKRSRVKVSAIAQLDRDLQLALGAKSIRIEAPVPGKGYVGIEIPNAENALVSLKDVMQAEQFEKLKGKSPLAIALGQSVDGTPISADLAAMPHLLIAGTTGSGKSVCINSIISSLLSNNTPEELKFIMVDPKRVELTGYNGIPHLVAPVVVELERIVGVLKWVTREMDERYKRFSTAGARNIVDFNKHLSPDDEQMPYIVVIIDELADLMMLAPEETERTITRIAALARATGIHLVIATQRPSVDVVTGLIKANFPARIAFAVAGSVDSRVILDQPGAERLLGRGDMLYLSGDSPAPQRLQGVFVSDDEIENINRYWKTHSHGLRPSPSRKMAPLTLDPASAPPQMAPAVMPGAAPQQRANQPELPMQQAFWDGGSSNGDDNIEPDDELYTEAVELVRRLNKASVSLLQRRLRIGYTRASRLIDLMEEQGVVGPQESGSKPREVLPG